MEDGVQGTGPGAHCGPGTRVENMNLRGGGVQDARPEVLCSTLW